MRINNIAFSIISCIALALFCIGWGQATIFSVAATDEITYTKVATLDELNAAISSGQQNIEITASITVSTDLSLSNINFYLNPANTQDCFKLNDATLLLNNCTITANLTPELTYDASNRPTAIDTTNVNYQFISGKGNLTMTNCEFSNIVYNSSKKIINISGTNDKTYEMNFLSANFKNIASNNGLILGIHTTINFGNSDKTQKCTIENIFCRGNGSFVLEQYSSLNLYAIDVLNCKYKGNGFFAVNFTGIVNLYSGLLQNNTGYPQSGGSWGTLIHLYDGTKFNMYGGEILNNVGYWAIIGTGRSGLDIHIVAGKIADNTGLDGTFETIEGTLEIEKDATIIGDIYNSGSSLKNSGTIKGNISIEDGSDTKPTTVENNGKIEGTVTIKNGTFDNKGEMNGKIDFEVSTDYSTGEPIETNGTLINSGTMDAEIDMKHGSITNNGRMDGKINVDKGTITNSKDFYAETTLNDGSITNGGTMYGKTTINGGGIANNKTIEGDVTINDGTFTNNDECNSNITISGGNFNNNKNTTGDVTNSGGTINNGNDATITGKVTISSGTTNNNGKIDGNIELNGGIFDNLNQIFGKIFTTSGTFTNSGKITGDVTVKGSSSFTNDGTINGKISGKITNNGTVNGPADFTWIYYVGGGILLLIIAIIIVCVIARKNRKPASIQLNNDVLNKTLRDKQKDDD